MDRWRGKIAIITGASSGIGAAISKKLVSEGLHVVGLARRKDRLDKLNEEVKDKPGKFYPYKVDVTNNTELINTLKEITETLGPIHVLVNSAGIVRDTNLIDGTPDDFKAVLDTNVLALAVVTREVVNNMTQHNVAGQIININSLAGHYIPNLRNFNLYPASKHAVTAYTEVLRNDLNRIHSMIKVTSLSPGATRSEILETNNATGEFSEDFKKGPRLECNEVADAVCYILSTPPNVQVQELTIRAMGEEI